MKISRKWAAYVLSVGSLLLVLAACVAVDQPLSTSPSVEVVKSDNDSREYRYVVLPNKLKVLLISDPDSDKAAASLDVNVGAGADPKDIEGLAHFLEHMLFLGTEKYPEAGAYQAFISAHGGRHNAYTSFEHTNYFFDIDPDYLDPALDRFAQFFISPLFNEQYVDREKNAVHSEYMAKIKDDSRKSLDVLKALVNPQHPFAKFTVGNLDTLKTDDEKSLRDALLAFYESHYSSNIMTLVVLGNESLTELEHLVRQKFTDIPNRDVVVEDIEQPLFSPQHQPLPLYVQIQPEKKLRTLSVAFPTEDEQPYYRQKPLYYLGNILGHEGQGSLLSWLKQRGWAEGLSAGSGLSYRGGSTFNLQIKLTPEGVKHVDAILAAVFQTIERIRQTPDQQWLYAEQQRLAQQSFQFQEKAAPISYVMSLSANMHVYAPEDTLRGAYLLEEYDRALIERFLKDFVPQNAIVTLNAPEAEVSEQTALYQTHYSATSVDQQQLANWQAASLNSAITLPQPNPFIAESLALKAPQFGEAEQAVYRAQSPKLIRNEAGLKLWYKPDAEFQVPRGSVFIKVNSPVAADTAEHQALLRLFVALVSDKLNERSYPAALAGLSFSLSADDQGFTVRIHGYDDKQALLLDDILAGISSADFDALRFDNIKLEQIRSLNNNIKEKPYQRTFDILNTVLHQQQFTDEQLLQAYQPLTLSALQAYHQQLFSEVELQVLVHGNFLQEEAEQLAAHCADSLLKRAASADLESVARLDNQQYALPIDSDRSDAALLLYLQGEDLSKKTRAALGLTAQIYRAPFYSELRTEKQLGYVVTSGAYPVRDVPGLFYLVQSPVAGPAALKREIEQFVVSQQATAEALTEEEFERHRRALILKLQEQPQNLWEQSSEYWQDIQNSYYQFNAKALIIEALNELTIDEWRAIYRQQVASLSRALWIYTDGKFAGSDESEPDISGHKVENLPTFKSQLRYYSFP